MSHFLHFLWPWKPLCTLMLCLLRQRLSAAFIPVYAGHCNSLAWSEGQDDFLFKALGENTPLHTQFTGGAKHTPNSLVKSCRNYEIWTQRTPYGTIIPPYFFPHLLLMRPSALPVSWSGTQSFLRSPHLLLEQRWARRVGTYENMQL